MNAVSSEADETYIKKILKDNLKITMILEFFMSTFTFNIWIELAIIPVITIITVMNVIAERKEEYKSVHKLLDSVLAIAGFWIFYETIKIGVKEYKQLNIINTLVSFMIPIVYLILIIPLEYILELYSKYEVLFLRMTFKEEKDKRIRLHHRIAILRECNFSVRKILLFQREYMIQMYDVKTDIFHSMPTAEIFPGVKEIMQKIKDAGMQVGVVTGSGQRPLIMRLLNDFGDFLDEEHIVTAYDVKRGKPNPDPYLMGLQKTGNLQPWEGIVVENAPLGVRAGVAANIFTVAINSGPLPDNELSDKGSNLLYHQMTEFCNDFESLIEMAHQQSQIFKTTKTCK